MRRTLRGNDKVDPNRENEGLANQQARENEEEETRRPSGSKVKSSLSPSLGGEIQSEFLLGLLHLPTQFASCSHYTPIVRCD